MKRYRLDDVIYHADLVGYGRCIVYRATKTVINKLNPKKIEGVHGPKVNESTGEVFFKHKILDQDGVVRAGEKIEKKLVLVNKYMAPKKLAAGKVDPSEIQETPLFYKSPGCCYVEEVI